MTKKEIIDVINSIQIPFYKDWGFWISVVLTIILGGISIYYSIRSFKEAKAAKEAAGKAGNTVKRQSIIIDIMEITRLCQIPFNVDYATASSNFNDVSAKIRYIFGLYSNDLNKSNPELFNKLETNLTDIRNSLTTINPITNSEISEVPNFTYFTLEPYFADLISNLGELKGVLDNKLIND